MTNPLLVFHMDFNYVAPRPEAVRATLAHVAARGYNAILWEAEDKVRWETLASAVSPEAMEKDEFRAVLDHARDLGLAAIPLLQTVGHGEYAMRAPEFAHLREVPDRHDCYCVSKPETRAFLTRLVDEYLDLFGDIEHFHLGGDEAYVFGQCPVCSARDRNTLYGEHIGALARPIRARGVRPGIWHDMVIAHPETLDRIDRSFLLWDWNYTDGLTPPEGVFVWGEQRVYPPAERPERIRKAFPEAVDADGRAVPFYTADALTRMGFDVVLCSAARSAVDSPFLPDWRVHGANVAGAARKARADGLAGTCVTSWAIRLLPWALQYPLIDLAPPLLLGRSDAPEDVLRETRVAYWGDLEEEKLLALLDWDSPLRLFTGVQWNGLKDGLPAPAGHLASRLAGEGDMLSVLPADVEGRVSALMDAIRENKPYVNDNTPFLRLFREGLALKHDELSAIRDVLRAGDPGAALARLDDVQARTEAFYRHEQQPASARHNTALLYGPMREWWEKRR